MPDTVPMVNPEGKPFDIHPDEVENMRKCGFMLVEHPKAEDTAPEKRKPGRPRKSEG